VLNHRRLQFCEEFTFPMSALYARVTFACRPNFPEARLPVPIWWNFLQPDFWTGQVSEHGAIYARLANRWRRGYLLLANRPFPS
jgi:hypothetical protein